MPCLGGPRAEWRIHAWRPREANQLLGRPRETRHSSGRPREARAPRYARPTGRTRVGGCVALDILRATRALFERSTRLLDKLAGARIKRNRASKQDKICLE